MTHELDSVTQRVGAARARACGLDETLNYKNNTTDTMIRVQSIQSELDQALATLQAYIERDGWKSIESAPKDERVQLYLSEFDVQHIAKWVQHPETGHESWLIVSGFDDEGNQVLCENPTHWRPLPTPPKGEES